MKQETTADGAESADPALCPGSGGCFFYRGLPASIGVSPLRRQVGIEAQQNPSAQKILPYPKGGRSSWQTGPLDYLWFE